MDVSIIDLTIRSTCCVCASIGKKWRASIGKKRLKWRQDILTFALVLVGEEMAGVWIETSSTFETLRMALNFFFSLDK